MFPYDADEFHAVAWIPYYARTGPIPYAGFATYVATRSRRRQKFKLKLAFKELFASGNSPVPPLTWSSHADYLSHLNSSEYRAAFFLKDVRVFRNSDGLVDATFTEVVDDSYIGFTPMRLIKPLKILAHYSPGRGRNTGVAVQRGLDRVVLEQQIGFMLGRWTNVVNRLLTTFWAPYAWMRVRYELFEDGRAKCRVTGSCLPNQSFYRCRHRRHLYSVEPLTAPEVAGFISRGHGKDAPQWNGSDVAI